jgi:hypothetical protein
MMDSKKSINQLAPVRRELGWGPRLRRGTDLLRLAGDHAVGVTAQCKMARRDF